MIEEARSGESALTQDLLTELFPVEASILPSLSAYRVEAVHGGRLGDALAARLALAYPGQWMWLAGRIVTDSPVSFIEMQIMLDILRAEQPEHFGGVGSIDEEPGWKAAPIDLAEFVLRIRQPEFEADLLAALSKLTIRLNRASVERECLIYPWDVWGQPSLLFTIRSRLLSEESAQHFLQRQPPDSLLGRSVKSREGISGKVQQISGVLGTLRDSILAESLPGPLVEYLQTAPDTEAVLRVRLGGDLFDLPAGWFSILIRPDQAEELSLFGISAEQAVNALRLKPDARAQIIRAASQVLKDRKIIGGAYNSRTHPAYFQSEAPTFELLFARNRSRPHNSASLGDDFTRSGVYKRLARFEQEPIRIAVINTLDDKIDDFVEALRRQLERQFEYKIEMIRERKVRVLNEKNLESAVKVAEKENPHLLLAFFPDESEAEDGALDSSYRHLKSLTLGRGIASHAVYPAVMNDPDAMAMVILAILGKTGNTPYVFTEPLPFADAVVGIELVRVEKKDHDQLAALARIFESDGQLSRYILHQMELDRGESIPFVVTQTLLPLESFGGKRVIVHRAGVFSDEELILLKRWGNVLKARFFPVEILTSAVPRLYGLEGGRVGHAPWGSGFRLNQWEAFVVTAPPHPKLTPMPLHLRSLDEALSIDEAIQSVLGWTLLHYGESAPTKLPVSIRFADEMARWMAKGVLPSESEGVTPFWL